MLAIEPRSVDGRHTYAHWLATQGRVHEAIEIQRKVAEDDPLGSSRWNNLGGYYQSSGQLDLSQKALERALEVGPDSDWPHFLLATNLLLQGKAAEALPWIAQIRSPFYKLAIESMAQHSLGHPKESEDALNELIRRYGKERPWHVAIPFAWRGDLDRAFEWLELAYQQRPHGRWVARPRAGLLGLLP